MSTSHEARPKEPAWNDQLRELRRRRGLSATRLALLSGRSLDSIRAYEMGRRRPTRAHLSRLLECLEADQPTRNVIFTDAGFSPDDGVGRYAERGLTKNEAASVVSGRVWPTLLVGGIYILAANDAASRLLDLPAKRTRRRSPDALTLATRRAVGRSCENWDELVAGTIAMLKSVEPREALREGPSPEFAPLLTAYCLGNPELLQRFAGLWAATPAFQPTYAGRTYRVIWRAGGRSKIRFEAVISCVNTVTGLYVHSWIPVDAASHRLLETRLRRAH